LGSKIGRTGDILPKELFQILLFGKVRIGSTKKLHNSLSTIGSMASGADQDLNPHGCLKISRSCFEWPQWSTASISRFTSFPESDEDIPSPYILSISMLFPSTHFWPFMS
jgi:hypothetical protein